MTCIDARISGAFAALSEQMTRLSVPERTVTSSEPIAAMIARVDAAKRRYQPGLR